MRSPKQDCFHEWLDNIEPEPKYFQKHAPLIAVEVIVIYAYEVTKSSENGTDTITEEGTDHE